jgi:hypothetical protein
MPIMTQATKTSNCEPRTSIGDVGTTLQLIGHRNKVFSIGLHCADDQKKGRNVIQIAINNQKTALARITGIDFINKFEDADANEDGNTLSEINRAIIASLSEKSSRATILYCAIPSSRGVNMPIGKVKVYDFNQASASAVIVANYATENRKMIGVAIAICDLAHPLAMLCDGQWKAC